MAKAFIDFTAVKAAVSFQQVLEHYGLTTSMRSVRNGDGLEGPCPIHEGTSQDIFKVTLSKNCYKTRIKSVADRGSKVSHL